MQNGKINITKRKLKETRIYRALIAILIILVLFLISGKPESLILKLLISILLGLWITYFTELIIFGSTKIDSTVENLKIVRIAILEEPDNAYIKKIPGLEIDTVSIPDDRFLYGVCFRVADDVYKLLASIEPSVETKQSFISSDVLLESFKGLQKDIVTTKHNEIILSFMPISKNVQILQTFRSDYSPLEVEVRYPYIKY